MIDYMMKTKFKNKVSKEKKEMFSAIMAVIILYVILENIGVTCPIKFVTGISCAGCGMSRAWMAFLNLDLNKAFYFHPLFLLPPICIFIFVFKNKINIRIYKMMIVTVIILFFCVYLYRMIDAGNDIVVFEPQNGLLFRLINFVKNIKK